jgi:transposase
MQIDLNNLPSDTALLHRLVREMAVVVDSRDGEIERLQLIIKKLQRAQFRRRSERLDADQLPLALEDLDGDVARIRESRPATATDALEARSRRKPPPDHLPRKDVVLAIAEDICGCCGGELHAIAESVSEMLDWVPAQLRVIRITRPKYACRSCNKVVQAAAPERLIASGLATPALLAQVMVSKYCDHTPLYRQSQIFARHGVDLGRSTLAGWVGGACWWLEALHERLCKHVFASDHLFADDTPIPVLDPGRGRTKTGRLWVYARDQRPWGRPAPPAAVYLFAPGRKAGSVNSMSSKYACAGNRPLIASPSGAPSPSVAFRLGQLRNAGREAAVDEQQLGLRLRMDPHHRLFGAGKLHTNQGPSPRPASTGEKSKALAL